MEHGIPKYNDLFARRKLRISGNMLGQSIDRSADLAKFDGFVSRQLALDSVGAQVRNRKNAERVSFPQHFAHRRCVDDSVCRFTHFGKEDDLTIVLWAEPNVSRISARIRNVLHNYSRFLTLDAKSETYLATFIRLAESINADQCSMGMFGVSVLQAQPDGLCHFLGSGRTATVRDRCRSWRAIGRIR